MINEGETRGLEDREPSVEIRQSSENWEYIKFINRLNN